jgi:hypothetical protein
MNYDFKIILKEWNIKSYYTSILLEILKHVAKPLAGQSVHELRFELTICKLRRSNATRYNITSFRRSREANADHDSFF